MQVAAGRPRQSATPPAEMPLNAPVRVTRIPPVSVQLAGSQRDPGGSWWSGSPSGTGGRLPRSPRNTGTRSGSEPSPQEARSGSRAHASRPVSVHGFRSPRSTASQQEALLAAWPQPTGGCPTRTYSWGHDGRGREQTPTTPPHQPQEAPTAADAACAAVVTPDAPPAAPLADPVELVRLRDQVTQLHEAIRHERALSRREVAQLRFELGATEKVTPWRTVRLLNWLVILALYGIAVGIATKLFMDWSNTGKHPASSIEVQKLSKFVPPWLVFMPDYTHSSHCGLMNVTCTFCPNCDMPGGEAKSIDCTPAVNFWTPSCLALGMPAACTELDCVKAKLDGQLVGPAYCNQPTHNGIFTGMSSILSLPRVLNRTTLKELGVRLSTTADQVLLSFLVSNLTECIHAPGDRTTPPGLYVWAVADDQVIAEMTANPESSNNLDRIGVPNMLGFGVRAQLNFELRKEIFLDGHTESKTLSSVTQYTPYLPRCQDDPFNDLPLRFNVSCESLLNMAPAFCLDANFTLCPKSCKKCQDPDTPRTDMLVRVSSFDIVASVWREGQSFLDLLGGVFGWVGVFTGACMQTFWGWALTWHRQKRIEQARQREWDRLEEEMQEILSADAAALLASPSESPTGKSGPACILK
eukprot:TRINITY_DN28617_c0_g1_i2.p1 TRINITY_DN28617_c0_g1~~TRINITY_DN28617_c0_g1_i2.p1  ORF type:complete len:639 (+),score=50.86 TRINITY_DN28617_c0_g1_i2:94-2010(+)